MRGNAVARDIKLLCSTALKTSFDEFTPQFERASGHRIAGSFGPTTELVRRISEGEASDVTIVTVEAVAPLIQQGRLVAGTQAVVARSGVGVAVRQGAPRPDISTPEKFKQAMLAAKSIAMSKPGGGQSGVVLAKAFERLGIAEAMKAKTTYAAGGPTGLSGQYVARGETELAVQQISELMAVPGIDVVGPLPGDLQGMTVFTASVSASASDAETAHALIRFLATPAAQAVMKAKGLEPG
jgi:molybdate transport system substrate-binding protein